MSDVAYNDKAAKQALAPVDPDQHQKALHETLDNVQQELEGTERRLRELRLIERSCQSALEAFEREPDESPSQDPRSARY